MEKPQREKIENTEGAKKKNAPQSALQPTLTAFQNLAARLIKVSSVELKKEEKDWSKNKALK